MKKRNICVCVIQWYYQVFFLRLQLDMRAVAEGYKDIDGSRK